jgi:hypothetical protein
MRFVWTPSTEMCLQYYSLNIAVVLNEATTCNGGDCRQSLLLKIQALLQGNQIKIFMAFHAYTVYLSTA